MILAISNSYIFIILFSLLIILSYLYNGIAAKTKIPSVLLLLITGIIAKLIFERIGFKTPDTKVALEVLGITGIILIVLEAALELKIRKNKLWPIAKAFFSAITVLLVSAISIAFGIKLFFPDFTFHICLVNAIPLAVISSAIAIPSVGKMAKEKKEFIIYESVFSDVLGILVFTIVSTNESFNMDNVTWLAIDFISVIAITLLFTFLILLFINRTNLKIKFFLLLSLLVLFYAVGKIIHISSLLMILFFGIILNNLNSINHNSFIRRFNLPKIQQSIEQFRLITSESAFIIRTFFFFIFGFTLSIQAIFDYKIILSGVVIIGILYGIRFLYLKFLARSNLFPELFIAPRGLITILLFYSIPPAYNIGVISEGLLFFVVIVTSIIMMWGLMRPTTTAIDLSPEVDHTQMNPENESPVSEDE